MSSAISLIDIAYNEAGLEYQVDPHSHQAFQWYCVLYGGVEQIVNNTPHLLNPEESILIPPGVIRSPRCHEKAPGYLFAIFQNHRLQLDSITNQVLVTPPDLRPDLYTLVQEVHQPGANTHELVEALVIRLLIGLERAAVQAERSNPARASSLNPLSQQDIVERVDAFMQRNLQRPLTREDLSRVVHLSPSHLARIFYQATSHTLTDHLTTLRIRQAKELLLQSTLSITAISQQVGYQSFSHFSKIFRQEVGISPSDYRRSQGHTWRKSE